MTVTIDLTPDISKQLTLHDQVHYSLRIKSLCKYRSRNDCQLNNKSHNGPIQYVLNLKTYQLEASTSMIKTNHHNWYVIVFANEMLNFITDYELKFWVYKELVIYIFCDFSHKSHTMHLMDYMIMSKYSCYHHFR